jgi:hypothetical protein
VYALHMLDDLPSVGHHTGTTNTLGSRLSPTDSRRRHWTLGSPVTHILHLLYDIIFQLPQIIILLEFFAKLKGQPLGRFGWHRRWWHIICLGGKKRQVHFRRRRRQGPVCIEGLSGECQDESTSPDRARAERTWKVRNRRNAGQVGDGMEAYGSEAASPCFT